VAAPVSLASFTAGVLAAVLCVLVLAFAYWTYGCWSLYYGLDRNALTIGWAGNRYRVPLKEITDLSQIPARTFGGLWWPGHQVGRGGDTLTFVTGSPALVLATPAGSYAISPPDPAAFVEELNIRARLGPTDELRTAAVRWWPWDLSVWHDPVAMGLLALTLLVNVALFAHQAWVLPSLPGEVPVHFTAFGFIDRAAPKQELLELPLGGLVLYLANAGLAGFLHRVERFAVYVVLGAGLVVQLFLWAAWLRVIG
jgi:hypothetical protein